MDANKKAKTDLAEALYLIGEHITDAETKQNRDLHRAVGLIVNVARAVGLSHHDGDLQAPVPA